MTSPLRPLGVGALLALSATLTQAQISDPIPGTPAKSSERVELETVASGIGSPSYLTSAGDGSGRLFFPEQSGLLRYYDPGTDSVETSLDVGGRLVSLSSGYDERGLLGAAFHPGFADSGSDGFGKVYTYTSEPDAGSPDFAVPPSTATGSVNHQSVVAEWQMNLSTGVVDPNSRRELLRFDQPQGNHNAGHMSFGPDGYLYVATGDGGAANDTGFGHVDNVGNAQTTGNILGKILRLDPLDPSLTGGSADAPSANGQYRVPDDNPFVGQSGVDEIYAYGLRNPFRFSFDDGPGGTDRLIAADVGQNEIEEVNIVTSGGNYGWNEKEGTFLFDPGTGEITVDSPGSPAGMTDPVLQYDHDEGTAVIGGFVYRGSALPQLQGKYIFGDLSNGFSSPNGRLFVGDLDTGLIEELTIGLDDRALGVFLKGFGQDADGELYVLGSTDLGPTGSGGVILKVVPVPEPGVLGLLAGLGAAAVMRRGRGWG